MNLSRAYALAYDVKDLSVGRVQTPTLAMLVERELAIRNFVPEDYREVQATFHPVGTPPKNTYQGDVVSRAPTAGTYAAASRWRRGGQDRRTRPHRVGGHRIYRSSDLSAWRRRGCTI
ncbi:MAG: DNA topoisomerase [Ignavibacteriota bacterium]